MTGDFAGSTAIALNDGLRCLDDFGNAGDGAAGADARDDKIHLAVGIAPDFLGGGFAMNFRVGRIGKLLGNEAVGNLSVAIPPPWQWRLSCLWHLR